MEQLELVNIIRELSEQLHGALKELRETQTTLAATQNEANDWFRQYQDAKNQLAAVYRTTKDA